MESIIILLVIILLGCAILIWFLITKWLPAISKLTTTLEKETQEALKTGSALQKNSREQMKYIWKQADSAKTALNGIGSLRQMVTELEQTAEDMQAIAQQLDNDAMRGGRISSTVTRQADSAAKRLTATANRAKYTYQLLFRSLDQLIADTEELRDFSKGNEVFAKELTGAVERVHGAVYKNNRLPHAVRELPSGNKLPSSQKNYSAPAAAAHKPDLKRKAKKSAQDDLDYNPPSEFRNEPFNARNHTPRYRMKEDESSDYSDYHHRYDDEYD